MKTFSCFYFVFIVAIGFASLNNVFCDNGPEPEPAQAESEAAPELAPRGVSSFVLYIRENTVAAGGNLRLTVAAVDEGGDAVRGYGGESFVLGGVEAAPDGTLPRYAPLSGWKEGVREYEVSLYRAGGPLRIFARDGEAAGESDELWVLPGEAEEVAIAGGDGQRGPAGKDVTEVRGEDPTVVVYDRWRNPVEEVKVQFENATNGGTFDVDGGAAGQQKVVVTGEGGRASCDVWVLGERYGVNKLDARLQGGLQRVQFTASSYWTAKKNLGLIFNFDLDNFDFESYQGGVGAKYYIGQKLAYRGLFSYQYINNSHSTKLTLGNSLEYHFLDGRLSPYAGGALDLGYGKVKGEIDADNWTEVAIRSMRVGPIIGVEMVVLDWLSLFVEYTVALEFSRTTTRTSIGGTVTETSGDDFIVNTGLGNDAMIGVVLYFNRIGKKW